MWIIGPARLCHQHRGLAAWSEFRLVLKDPARPVNPIAAGMGDRVGVRTSTPEYARVRPSTHEYARVRTSTPEYARVRPSTHEYARVCPSTPEYARVRTSTHEYARVRPSTPEYARVRPSTHEYARVRTSTPKYARVRPSTHDYARVRPSTPEYARVRPSTPEYARVRTSTHDYARVRTSLFQSMCIHCWKSIMRKSCLQMRGGGGEVPPPQPLLYFLPRKLASTHMHAFSATHHASIVFANGNPPAFLSQASLLQSICHMHTLKCCKSIMPESCLQIWGRFILGRASLLQSIDIHFENPSCENRVLQMGGGGLRSLPIPSFLKAAQAVFKAYTYMPFVRASPTK